MFLASARALARHRVGLGQLVRFSVVGGTGVLVNLLAIIVCDRLGPGAHRVAVDLPLTSYNVRYYHVYATVAFLVANLWNFQINRSWTFGTSRHARWLSEYVPFLVAGLAALVLNLLLLTLLLHRGSPVALPTSVFDDSTALRNRLYWAQLIAICVVTPVSFLINKYWTFTAVLGGVPEPGEAEPDRASAP